MAKHGQSNVKKKPEEESCMHRRSSRSRSKAKVFDGNWITSKHKSKAECQQNETSVNNELVIHSCKKCYRVFRNRNDVKSHEKDCLILEPTDSFLKFETRESRLSYDKSGKVLPLSQPLISWETSTETDISTDIRTLEQLPVTSTSLTQIASTNVSPSAVKGFLPSTDSPINPINMVDKSTEQEENDDDFHTKCDENPTKLLPTPEQPPVTVPSPGKFSNHVTIPSNIEQTPTNLSSNPEQPPVTVPSPGKYTDSIKITSNEQTPMNFLPTPEQPPVNVPSPGKYSNYVTIPSNIEQTPKKLLPTPEQPPVNVPSPGKYTNSVTIPSNIEKSSAKPSIVNLVICKFCHETFRNKKGLGVHLRYCKLKPKIITDTISEAGCNNNVATINLATGDPHIKQNPELNPTGSRQTAGVWGNISGDDLNQIINSIYEEIVFWKKNLFKLPSGSAGKRFIKEKTRLIEFFNENAVILSDISLKMVMIMPALLLQKPCQKSTAKQHTEYLNRRMDLWDKGDFDEIMKGCRAIQNKIKQYGNIQNNSEHIAKSFSKLMLQGKVNAALRLLDNESSLGIANLNEEKMNELRNLHPQAKPATFETLISGEVPYFDPVMFYNIDETAIAVAASRTKGAAGPSGLDADGWRRILISRNYGKTGKDLRTSIAKMTQILCTRNFNETNIESLQPYVACRLIPLEKESGGVRPIGIGEVLRRIIGKAIIGETRPDLAESAGCLQLCAGQKSGCEAAAHAMHKIFEEEETDAILLIDASNAFNSLNREALLHNIKHICPAIATYVRNCYGKPSRMFVAGGREVESSEGTTQGDPLAMPSYAMGILPFMAVIKPEEKSDEIKHVAYADDIAGASKLIALKEWWDRTNEFGPAIGYHPKPSKSWLVVKEQKLEEAREIFHGTGINITTEGKKYLGGFVGNIDAKEEYVNGLIDGWIKQLEKLVKIAKSEPQAAYSAYTSGFKHKPTYYLRTIPNISHLMKRLDDVIDQKFIPAITEGHVCSRDDRRLLALPVRLGGMGIPIFSENSERELENSYMATEQLVSKIKAQDLEYKSNQQQQKNIENVIKKRKNELYQNELNDIRSRMEREQVRANDIAQMKGASAWLTALPLKEENYVLTKREFYDAISLRYRWQLKRLPQKCACGRNYEIDHAMTCLKGGFIHRRHDNVRDLVGELLNEVAYDVQIEPPLQPLTGEDLPHSSNKEDEARLDISARGFWNKCEMAFYDVRVFNPFAKSHLNRNLESVFSSNESLKKKSYNQRVIQVEHASFTPIVVSAYGGFGRETNHFLSTLARKLSIKKDMQIADISRYIRTKISFDLVRGQVMCIRGSRSMKKPVIDAADIEAVQIVANIKE